MNDANNNNNAVGSKVTNSAAFKALNGSWFAAGTVFTIDLVGSVNTRAIADRTGDVVWISDGVFCAAR